MIDYLIDQFGTDDLEWFCAAESILNTIFNIKTKSSHDYAKMFIEKLVKKMHTPQDEEMNGTQLRTNLSELHYSQLFFSVGHVAIKMLTFIEQMENDLKKAVADSFNAK